MKKMIQLLLIGAGIITGIAFVVRRRKKQPPDTVPLRGSVEYVKIVPPRYVDPKRIGSRIDFTIHLWGTNETKVKIQNIVVLISSKTSATLTWERPLWGTNPIAKNYVFHKGIHARDGVCAYVDDVKPQDIDADSLVVQITDTMGMKYLIEKSQ
jgi:LPXTG-motif cell wall-anchored protein